MKLTVQVKLVVSPEESEILRETLTRLNSACNAISDFAWEEKVFRTYDLHGFVYYKVKEEFGISGRMVEHCYRKVGQSYVADKSAKHSFEPLGSFPFDKLSLSWKMDAQRISIWTLAGRMKLPFVCGPHQKELLLHQKGETDLVFRNGEWYLFTTVEVAEPSSVDTSGGVLGVDLGVENIATDSTGNNYSGDAVKKYRQRIKRIRTLLQKKGTKSAKRHLRKISRKQSRYVRNMNHVISKTIVATAISEKKALALENLKGLKARANGLNKEMRWLLGGWAYAQLGMFVDYKARLSGVPLIFVDPRNTSRECPECHHCAKENRPSRNVFECIKCGFSGPADHIAARNIEVRGALGFTLLSGTA